MPELAAITLVGSILSLIVGILFGIIEISRYNKTHYKTLQQNLALINLRWNDLEGAAENLPIGRQQELHEKEIRKAKRTYMIFTFAGVLLSWLGLFLLILMWISVKKLIKNRLERNVFNSNLVTEVLKPDQVTEKWQSLQV